MKTCWGAIVVLMVGNIAFWYFMGPQIYIEDRVSTPQKVAPEVVDVFSFTLQEEVDKKLGTPVEGYEPKMFLEVFPGLTATDFEGVEASLGYYTFSDGELELVLDETQLIHSAAGAITRTGMNTLLSNVSERTSINLQEDGTITDVVRYLIGT